MHRKKFYIKRAALSVILLSLTWFAFTSKMNYMSNVALTAPDSIFTTKTLMKAIPCSNPETELLGFEVHTKYVKHAGKTHTEYNVVMRSLDPSIDTYKTYCHDIIADLAMGMGPNEDVTINVFDSFEAYCFYNDATPFKQDEAELLPQHLVATYERGQRCDEDDRRYCSLTFYPYSAGRLRETASYSL